MVTCFKAGTFLSRELAGSYPTQGMVFYSVPSDEEDTFLYSGRRYLEQKEKDLTRKRMRILGKKRKLRRRIAEEMK
jgi:hypothetical protein